MTGAGLGHSQGSPPLPPKENKNPFSSSYQQMMMAPIRARRKPKVTQNANQNCKMGIICVGERYSQTGQDELKLCWSAAQAFQAFILHNLISPFIFPFLLPALPHALLNPAAAALAWNAGLVWGDTFEKRKLQFAFCLCNFIGFEWFLKYFSCKVLAVAVNSCDTTRGLAQGNSRVIKSQNLFIFLFC